MEQHSDIDPMHTPFANHDVGSSLPTPAGDVDPLQAAPLVSDRIVRVGSPGVVGDRGLERLSASRVTELRRRLEAGVYGSPDVMTVVAVRLLESGDL